MSQSGSGGCCCQPKPCESSCEPYHCSFDCEGYERTSCCGAASQGQTGTQTASNSHQKNKQYNTVTITNAQGVGNLNLPVQTSLTGDNNSHVTQGSYNSAPTTVWQSNVNDQTQSNTQHQTLVQDVRRACGI